LEQFCNENKNKIVLLTLEWDDPEKGEKSFAQVIGLNEGHTACKCSPVVASENGRATEAVISDEELEFTMDNEPAFFANDLRGLHYDVSAAQFNPGGLKFNVAVSPDN
jgi:hypothetical protein